MKNNTEQKNSPLKLEDFIIKESIGKGGFAEVFLVINKNNNEKYALKIIDKSFINKFEKKHYILLEKTILCHLNNSKIVKLNATF